MRQVDFNGEKEREIHRTSLICNGIMDGKIEEKHTQKMNMSMQCTYMGNCKRASK